MNFTDFGIILNDTGGQQKVSCPECTPSRKKKNLKDLSVNVSDGVWNCHHCGWVGGLNKKTDYNPMDKPVQKVYVKPKYREPKVENKTASYLEERGISIETQLKYEVSCEQVWMPQTQKEENCVVFNYFVDGELVNRKYRDGKKNMKMEKDCRLVMYNPSKTEKREITTLYITEGEFDCLTLLECGFDGVLSVPNGAPAENVDLFNVDLSYLDTIKEIFTGYKKVVLVMDSDKVGERFRDEIARRIGYEICSRVSYPEGCKDINDTLVKFGKQDVSNCIENSKEYPIEGLYAANDFKDSLFNIFENGFEHGARTGWGDLDKIYSPRKKEFTIVTGIPSHGKSVWLDNLMVNIIGREHWKFVVFSPENAPCERHIANLSEIIIGKPFDRQYSGHMSREELEQAHSIIHDYVHFVMPKSEGFTIDGILDLAKSAVSRYGVNGVIIDPWNEIEHNRGNIPETDYVSKALTKIRNFSRFNDVHTWIVAHPTKLQKDKKTGEYPPPTPYDISGSSHWRNKADNCICVHRFFDKKITMVQAQKIRFKECGKIGEAFLKFDIKCNTFYELNSQEKSQAEVT